jgi:hypothetical protein
VDASVGATVDGEEGVGRGEGTTRERESSHQRRLFRLLSSSIQQLLVEPSHIIFHLYINFHVKSNHNLSITKREIYDRFMNLDLSGILLFVLRN